MKTQDYENLEFLRSASDKENFFELPKLIKKIIQFYFRKTLKKYEY